jgi:hypothetical protein
VPAINLRDEVKKDTCVIIDWSTDRNLTESTFKSLACWFVETFNDMIENVIDNGTTSISSEFTQKWLSLFCSATSRKVYAHSIYTLLLPALVNILSRASKCAPAHEYLGYVSKSSKMFPYDSSRPNEYWRGKKYDAPANYVKTTVTLGNTIVNTNFNNLLITGTYCFPFGTNFHISKNYTLSSNPAPKNLDLYIPGITFKTDNYKNNKPTLLSKTYLTLCEDYVENYVNVYTPLTLQHLELKTTLQGYGLPIWAVTCVDYQITYKPFSYYEVIDLKDPSSKLENAELGKPYVLKPDDVPICGAYSINRSPCLKYPCSVPAEYLHLSSAGWRKLTYSLRGTFNTIVFTPSDYENRYNEMKTVTLFSPAFDVYYIHTSTINKWMSILESCAQYAFEQFYKAITPEMTLMHYIGKKFRNISTSVALWSLPLGPPCLRPASQTVLPSKNYYANYQVTSDCIQTKSVSTKTYIQNSFESIIAGNKFTDIYTFTLALPSFGYELFDLVGATNNAKLSVTNLNSYADSDVSKTKIVVKVGPLDSNLLSSYTEIAQLYIPMFRTTISGNIIKLQFNDAQFDASSSKLAAAKQLLNNKIYVYVSKPSSDNLGTYTVETNLTQLDGTIEIPYFKLKFNANEIKSLPVIIKKRSYD